MQNAALTKRRRAARAGMRCSTPVPTRNALQACRTGDQSAPLRPAALVNATYNPGWV
jgi:hypothetical protein